jgi:predicted amidohydrolase YtcJ
MALDAIASARKSPSSPLLPPAITHLQLVDPSDLPRFKALGAVAVVQPYWFVIDKYYFWNIQVPYLGKPRADIEYPMRSFMNEGVLVTSSSDYPVTVPPNPLAGIETGMLRWYQDGSDGNEVLWPKERCTLEQMINTFTIDGAKSLSLEKISGSIEAGKSADFIILNRNILKIPAQQIGDLKLTNVQSTYFRGRKIYERGAKQLTR